MTADPVCPYCGQPAQFVTGEVIYPHRADLAAKRFWACMGCGAWVGCHPPNRKHGHQGHEPLGRLANAQLRAAKQGAHAAFDPIWKNGNMSRKEAYWWLAAMLGLERDACHIGEFDVETCKRVMAICAEAKKDRPAATGRR